MNAPLKKTDSRGISTLWSKMHKRIPGVAKVVISKKFSIAVIVSDAKKSAAWFEDKLGFESSVEGHWVLVWPKGSGTKIHLCEGKPDPGNTGIAFYVKGASGLASKMKRGGVKFTQDVKKVSWGTNGMFSDLDGNEYWLIEGSGP
jgi:catechol 2,3-dioxygenase-like lactoylglutathione lyase family enzyme